MKMYGKHQARKIMYSLKKHWSYPLDWYRLISTITDRRTGKKVTDWVKARVRKAILLPKVDTREFKYSLSYLAANKNFVYGGYFDKSKRYVLIEARDLPDTWTIDTDQVEFNDKIIINNDRYELSKAENYDESGAVYIITLTHVKASDAEEYIEVEASNTLEVADETISS